MDKQIVISIKTILIAFLMLLGGYVIFRLGNVIGVLVIALMLVISLEHGVQYFMSQTLFNKKIPRNVAVLLMYFLFIFALILTFTIVLPPVVSQVENLIEGLNQIAVQFNLIQAGDKFGVSDFLSDTKTLSTGVVSFTVSLFSNLATVASMFVISIYLSLDWVNIKKRFCELFPERLEDDVHETLEEIEVNVGHWVKGQLILMTTIGVMSFLGLIILDVKCSGALGLVSGVLEIVPIVGPMVSAILAGIVGFAESPIKGIGVVALFTLIQQLENNLLVPKIMEKVSGFRPIVILLSLLVGTEFFGIIGALLAVPVMMILTIVLKRVLRYSR